MTDLPVCRLCKETPVIGQQKLFVTCPNESCVMNEICITNEEWRKLMYVPAKKEEAPPNPFVGGYARGYNAAIDDMEKGGV